MTKAERIEILEKKVDELKGKNAELEFEVNTLNRRVLGDYAAEQKQLKTKVKTIVDPIFETIKNIYDEHFYRLYNEKRERNAKKR